MTNLHSCHSIDPLKSVKLETGIILSYELFDFGSAWVSQGHSELSLCHLGHALTLIVLREREASSQTEVLERSGSGHHQAPMLGTVLAGDEICLVSSKYSISN